MTRRKIVTKPGSNSVSHFYRIIPQIPSIRFAIRTDVQDVHKSISFYSEYGDPAH